MVTLACTVFSLLLLSAPKQEATASCKRTTCAISKSQLEQFFIRVVTPKPKPKPYVLPGKFLHLLNSSTVVSQVAKKMQKEVLARALFLRYTIGE